MHPPSHLATSSPKKTTFKRQIKNQTRQTNQTKAKEERRKGWGGEEKNFFLEAVVWLHHLVPSSSFASILCHESSVCFNASILCHIIENGLSPVLPQTSCSCFVLECQICRFICFSCYNYSYMRHILVQANSSLVLDASFTGQPNIFLLLSPRLCGSMGDGNMPSLSLDTYERVGPGIRRTGELALSFTCCSKWEHKPCITVGRYTRAEQHLTRGMPKLEGR